MKYYLLLSTMLFSLALSSQDLGTIKGHITDREVNYEPLMMASIHLEGSGKIVQSNLHGNFEIAGVTPGNYILTISFAGYDSKEIRVEVNSNEVSEVVTDLAAKTLDIDIASLLSEKNDSSQLLFANEEKEDKE
ncbi:MAG: carboxypeptidase-like regulatory domain-containing protein [Eudoraea sp.]|nr:carboxypeptidase-like regulatory domain-containing protein [Eudoraea sp.]